MNEVENRRYRTAARIALLSSMVAILAGAIAIANGGLDLVEKLLPRIVEPTEDDFADQIQLDQAKKRNE